MLLLHKEEARRAATRAPTPPNPAPAPTRSTAPLKKPTRVRGDSVPCRSARCPRILLLPQSGPAGSLAIQVAPEKRERSFPCHLGSPGIVFRPIRLEEPVLCTWIGIERHFPPYATQMCLHCLHTFLRLKVIVFSKVTKKGRLGSHTLRIGESVESHDCADRIFHHQRPETSHRKAHHTHALAKGLRSRQQIRDSSRNILKRLVLINSRHYLFGLLNRLNRSPAMVEIWRKYHKTLLRKALAQSSKKLIEAPPRVQNQDTWSFLRCWQSQVSWNLALSYCKDDTTCHNVIPLSIPVFLLNNRDKEN